MKNILVTGGTVFVSRYISEYYLKKGYNVFVLNRNSKIQSDGVTLIKTDRHDIGDKLSGYHFDVIFDVTAYTATDINSLLDAIESYDDYIFISSSAVYPEWGSQPFKESSQLGINKFWGKYGINKIEAEQALLTRNPNAYILRPPYLYGQMNNIYRESFVFDCALSNRVFYLPKQGNMKLQFFHVDDLCKFIDAILDKRPSQHIFNVGNKETISIYDWVTLCYEIAGKKVEFINVNADIEQRNYFCFYDYEYDLDIHQQEKLMPKTKPLKEGFVESFEWYIENTDNINKKPFIEYIETNLNT